MSSELLMQLGCSSAADTIAVTILPAVVVQETSSVAVGTLALEATEVMESYISDANKKRHR